MVPVHILIEDNPSRCGGRRAAAATGSARVPHFLALLQRVALHPRGVGRTAAGGCCMCQRGSPYRVVDPPGVPVSFGAPPVWGALGRLGTAAAAGLRRVPGGPVIQGCSRYYAPAWPHGCAGRRAGATASAVSSFHLGCRLPYAPRAGWPHSAIGRGGPWWRGACALSDDQT